MYNILLLSYGQPPQWVGGLAALGMIVFVVSCLMHGMANPIGYILEPEHSAVASVPVQTKHHLYDDGVAVLVGLGYKKMESKKMAQKVFDNHEVQTIQDFVVLVNMKD